MNRLREIFFIGLCMLSSSLWADLRVAKEIGDDLAYRMLRKGSFMYVPVYYLEFPAPQFPADYGITTLMGIEQEQDGVVERSNHIPNPINLFLWRMVAQAFANNLIEDICEGKNQLNEISSMTRELVSPLCSHGEVIDSLRLESLFRLVLWFDAPESALEKFINLYLEYFTAAKSDEERESLLKLTFTNLFLSPYLLLEQK